jgi:hypothetical protein
MARKKNEVILGGTRAMLAGHALRKQAQKDRELADSLNPAAVARNTIPNLRYLAEMYDEVADALNALDAGATIVPEPLVAPEPEQEQLTPADRDEASIGLGEIDGSGE